MPRDIRSEIRDAAQQVVTAPVFLFEAWLEQHNYLVCSFDSQIYVHDRLWKDANLTVRGPTQYSGGTLKASVSVPYDTPSQNDDAILIDDILAKRPQDRRCRLWQTYWYNDAYVEPVLLVNGIIDDVTLPRGSTEKPRVTFDIVSKGNRGGVTPFVRLMPPTCNHITPDGSVLSFNGTKYEVKR